MMYPDLLQKLLPYLPWATNLSGDIENYELLASLPAAHPGGGKWGKQVGSILTTLLLCETQIGG